MSTNVRESSKGLDSMGFWILSGGLRNAKTNFNLMEFGYSYMGRNIFYKPKILIPSRIFVSNPHFNVPNVFPDHWIVLLDDLDN